MESRKPLLVDPREAARLLSVSPRTLWDWTKQNRIRSIKVSRGMIRYPLAELERFIEQELAKDS